MQRLVQNWHRANPTSDDPRHDVQGERSRYPKFKVIDISRELERVGVSVQVADPIASAEETAHEYGIKLTPDRIAAAADAVILAVAPQRLCGGRLAVDRQTAQAKRGHCARRKSKARSRKKPDGIDLWRL